MPRATLIIPTFNRQSLLGPLLDQIAEQNSDDFETLIVDQSPNASQAIIARASKEQRLRYIHATHASLPNARNIGVKEAKGAIIIFIDDDVTLDKGFVAAHIAAFEKEEIHAIAGRITGAYDEGSISPSAKSVGRFSPWTATVSRNFNGTEAVEDIDQLPGGNFSIRRDAYLKIGGFDLVAFGGRASIGEETDFACRLNDAAGRIDFEPDALLHHDHADEGGCRDDNRREWTYWHAHNYATIALRYLAIWRWPVFFGVFFLRYLVHGLKAFNPLVAFAGWRGLLAPFFKVIHPPKELQTLGEWSEPKEEA